MWWELLHTVSWKFLSLYSSAQIFEIDKDLTKLSPKFGTTVFLGHSVYNIYQRQADVGTNVKLIEIQVKLVARALHKMDIFLCQNTKYGINYFVELCTASTYTAGVLGRTAFCRRTRAVRPCAVLYVLRGYACQHGCRQLLSYLPRTHWHGATHFYLETGSCRCAS